MTRTRPDLIVPIRDRRRGKRILTLKNLQNVTAVALVLFIALTVVSEVRDRKGHEGYGRLLSQQIPAPPPAASKPQVVVEAPPIPDQEHADPLLLTSAAREQYLGVNQPITQPITASAMAPAPTSEDFARPEPVLGSGNRHVAIVGDTSGVQIVTTSTQRGTLGGGIFRQQ